MIKALFLFSLFLYVLTLSAAELIAVNGESAQQFQESAFIKLMNNLNNGTIPYPFSNLLDSFGPVLNLRETGHVLFVPKGRSLVKEFANFHDPRIIINVFDRQIDAANKLGFQAGDLYIGYAPNHKALEIISYNPAKPGFDFFVVENYQQGQTPKIVNNPALCLSCHQNEGPIFPRSPWHETLGTTADLDEKSDLFDVPGSQIMDLVRKANPERKEIEGISLDEHRISFPNDVINFDREVRNSNVKLAKIKACEVLCPDKSDSQCAKELVLNAFSNDPQYASSPFFKNAENNLKNIDFKSSVIPDREPETNKGIRSVLTAQEMNQFFDKDAQKEVLDIFGELKKYDLTYIEDSPGMNGASIKVTDDDFINPAAERPLNSDIMSLQRTVAKNKTINKKISHIAELCLSFRDQKLSLDEIKKMISSGSITPDFLKNKKVAAELKKWPNTDNLARVILEETTKSKYSEYGTINCHNQLNPTLPVYKYSDINNAIVKLTDEKIRKPEALFAKYCTKCHGGEAPFILLPLGSLVDMANYIPSFSTKGVQERLEKKIMPPSLEELQPSQTERDEMIEAIKAATK
jgi:hypothetical protein